MVYTNIVPLLVAIAWLKDYGFSPSTGGVFDPSRLVLGACASVD